MKILWLLMLLRPVGTFVPSSRAVRPLARRAAPRLTSSPMLCLSIPPFGRMAVQLSTAAAPVRHSNVAAPAVPPPSGTDVAPTTEPHAASPIPDIAPVFEVEDVATAEAVVARLMEMPPHMIHACDTEVADIDITKSPIGQGRVTCISLYSGPDADYGRGPGHALWVDTSDEAVLLAFRPFLESERHLKAWHNYAFDRHVLWNHGLDVKELGGDTMHMARLWDASRKEGYSLAALTEELLDRRKEKMIDLFGVPEYKKDGTPGKRRILPDADELQNNPLTRPDWIEYSVYDAQGTWMLHQKLEGFLADMVWQNGLSNLTTTGGTGSRSAAC